MNCFYILVVCFIFISAAFSRPEPVFAQNSTTETTNKTLQLNSTLNATAGADDKRPSANLNQTISKDNQAVSNKTKEDTVSQPENVKHRENSKSTPTKTVPGHFILETGASIGKSHHETSHPGVAIPMTVEDIEHEIGEVNQKVKAKESSTSKEGISTWILLSGSNPTAKPNNRAPSFRVETETKLEKIARLEEVYKQKRTTTSKPDIVKTKNKTKIASSGVTSNKSELNETVRPVKIIQKKKVEDQTKPVRKTTAISTTTTEIPKTTTKTSPVRKEESVPFLIIEPKDAEFNLPQDRSPGQSYKQKRPNVTQKPKKKNNNKKTAEVKDQQSDDLLRNNTKVANKLKDTSKPMTTKIYNYLAREVMPTVGVGLLGLVVTAGLAGYFFGPLGALRRSYDISDRKDDLYHYNDEEYAGSDGQSEEDIFGKVIAGMPMNSNYRNNVRYTSQRPNQYAQNGPKYAYQYNRYKPIERPQQMPYINYQSRVQQPAYQKSQPLNPNAVLKKSISNPVFYQNPSSTSVKPSESTLLYSKTSPTTTTTTTTPTIPTTKSTENTAIFYADHTTQSPLALFDPEKLAEFSDPNANELKRRSQFVVGSVLPDVIEEDDDDHMSAAPVPEHGPRRRRKRALTSETLTESDLKKIENLVVTLKGRISKMEKNDKITKEMKNVEYQINRLKRVIAEIKDIEQFQNEFHFETKNTDLKETISNGIIHIQEDIKFVNELLDKPQDIDQLLADRKNMEKTVNNKVKTVLVSIVKKSDTNSTEISATNTQLYTPSNITTTDRPSGLMGLLKLLELKAAFGINLMQSVRPAFDRAFQQVFNGTHTA